MAQLRRLMLPFLSKGLAEDFAASEKLIEKAILRVASLLEDTRVYAELVVNPGSRFSGRQDLRDAVTSAFICAMDFRRDLRTGAPLSSTGLLSWTAGHELKLLGLLNCSNASGNGIRSPNSTPFGEPRVVVRIHWWEEIFGADPEIDPVWSTRRGKFVMSSWLEREKPMIRLFLMLGEEVQPGGIRAAYAKERPGYRA
jgi:hypothetical protein